MLGCSRYNFGGYSFGQRYIPAWVAINLLTTAFFTLGTVLTAYREQEILRRLKATPLKPWMILVSHTIHGLYIFLISEFILLMFGLNFYGLKLPAYPVDTVIAILISTCAIFPFGLLTSLAKTTRTASAISSLVLNISIFLSGATFPVEMMPSYMQLIAKMLPLYYVVEMVRGTWNELLPMTILMVISIASITLSTLFLNGIKMTESSV